MRIFFGGAFSVALLTAPLAVLAAAPTGAATGHAVRPFLAQSPRTFPPAQVTFTVNTTNDTDVSPGTGTSCTDSGGQCSIRAAVEAANNLGQTVNVNIPPGTYTLTNVEGGSVPAPLSVTDPAGLQLTATGAGVDISNGGAASDIIETDLANPSAPGAFLSLSGVVIQGSGGGGLIVNDPNDTATVSGVTFFANSQNGNGGALYNEGQTWVSGSNFAANHATSRGGAVYNDNGSLRVTGDSFNNNSSDSEAGALYTDNGPASVDNSSFTSNSVSGDGVDGGAIVANDEMELTGDTFTSNSANATTGGTALGGAVYDEYGLNSIVNSTFTGNSSNSTDSNQGGGGAIYDDNAVTITGSTITGNSAGTGDGGGIFENSLGLILNNDTVSNNTATGTDGDNSGAGGGVFAFDIATIGATTISGNTANFGGGLASDDGIIVTNTTISGNTANQGGGSWSEGRYGVQMTSTAIVDNTTTGANDAGGGVFVSDNNDEPSHIDFHAVTVSGNVSDTGAGIGVADFSGAGSLANSTVAGNTTPGGSEQDCAFVPGTNVTPLGSGGGNVIGDATCNLPTSSDRQGAGQQGYTLDASDGGIFTYNTTFFGSMGGKALNKPIVGMAHTPGNQGYWEVASDGGVFSFGDAGFFGSMGGKPLNQPVVGIASTPDGQGYIEVASDGGVFTFGDAGFFGSMGGKALNKPIVGIAVTPDGRGYWEVASDGGIFAFGNAGFFGSMGGKALNKPIVGIAQATDGMGYDEVASDGGVFNFGSAHFFGSAGALKLNAPVVGIAVAPDNHGYWTFAADGGVFNYGNGAQFKGSAGALKLVKPVVGGAGT
jgi:hypothetical protein